jgi:hypothetical protein
VSRFKSWAYGLEKAQAVEGEGSAGDGGEREEDVPLLKRARERTRPEERMFTEPAGEEKNEGAEEKRKSRKQQGSRAADGDLSGWVPASRTHASSPSNLRPPSLAG